jgi:hypothetical protein
VGKRGNEQAKEEHLKVMQNRWKGVEKLRMESGSRMGRTTESKIGKGKEDTE